MLICITNIEKIFVMNNLNNLRFLFKLSVIVIVMLVRFDSQTKLIRISIIILKANNILC
jgi:hypothetical protein